MFEATGDVSSDDEDATGDEGDEGDARRVQFSQFSQAEPSPRRGDGEQPPELTEQWSRRDDDQRVAVLLVLGALQKWPHQMEQELRKRLERKVASRLELCGVKGVGGASFVLRSVFWPVALRGALDGDVAQWTQVADATGGNAANSPRRAMMDFSLFCSRYTRGDGEYASASGGGSAGECGRLIATAMQELASVAGATAPLVVVAHQLGCVPALDELQHLQEQREAGMRSFRSNAPSRRTDNADTVGGGGASSSRPAEAAGAAAGAAAAAPTERPDSSSTPLQMGETLAAVYTLGCPHPLWREVATRRDAATGGGTANSEHSHALVLRVPAPQLSQHHAELCKDGGPPDTLRWANYWHPCDPLGYPLAGMVAKRAAVVDTPVKMGVVECGPLDYIMKGSSKEIFSPLSHAIVSMWLSVNPHVEADTTQLDALKEHGSGTRAAASKNAKIAGEKASRTAHKFVAATHHLGANIMSKAANASSENRRMSARPQQGDASAASGHIAYTPADQPCSSGGYYGGGGGGSGGESGGGGGDRPGSSKETPRGGIAGRATNMLRKLEAKVDATHTKEHMSSMAAKANHLAKKALDPSKAKGMLQHKGGGLFLKRRDSRDSGKAKASTMDEYTPVGSPREVTAHRNHHL